MSQPSRKRRGLPPISKAQLVADLKAMGLDPKVAANGAVYV